MFAPQRQQVQKEIVYRYPFYYRPYVSPWNYSDWYPYYGPVGWGGGYSGGIRTGGGHHGGGHH